MGSKRDTKLIPAALLVALAMSVFSFWCAFSLSRTIHNYDDLTHRGVVTEGTAIKAWSTVKATLVSYEFNVNGQTIRATTPVAWSWAKDAKFPQSVRIRYLAERPEISEAFELRNHRVEPSYFLVLVCVASGFAFALTGIALIRSAIRNWRSVITNPA